MKALLVVCCGLTVFIMGWIGIDMAQEEFNPNHRYQSSLRDTVVGQHYSRVKNVVTRWETPMRSEGDSHIFVDYYAGQDNPCYLTIEEKGDIVTDLKVSGKCIRD